MDANLKNRLFSDEIAIVGIGCRYPGGVHGPADFWDFLKRADDGICEIPADRWSIRDHYDKRSNAAGKTYVKSAAFLNDWSPYAFDPGFFGISVREAESMDPQQRLMLELAWEAAQDAGIAMDALSAAQTGVFFGCFTLDNKTRIFGRSDHGGLDAHAATSSTMAILSNRVSYIFDLSGPSFTVDTACSSSMVALHNAVLAMRNGDCDYALVGGVNVMLQPEYFIAMGKGGYLAADGRCKSFDVRADGYGRGEGGGMILLKPLSQALQDGDRVYATIAGTGINQDGHTNGMSVPSGEAQSALIQTVLEQSGVAAHEITYIEAHGTGTAVGDPIECNALGSTYGKDRTEPCAVGSVKSSIGHQEAGAGVAGVIKAALSLYHGQIVPQSGLTTLNPAIPFDALGLRVSQDLRQMPNAQSAHAAINSFGYGGTNGHAILRRAPVQPRTERAAQVTAPNFAATSLVLPLSAQDPTALRAVAQQFATALSTAEGDEKVQDLIWSACHRQSQLDHRLVAIADDTQSLITMLQAFARDGHHPTIVTGRAVGPAKPDQTSAPVFVFSGMGPQWWAMGQELYRTEPVFRAAAQECDTAFEAVSGWSIWAEMSKPEGESRMADTRVAQPANVLLQIALTALYKSCGIAPSAVVGHSVGEITSAAVSGCLTITEAMAVAFHRSSKQALAAGQGTMLAVALEEAECAALIAELAPDVAIAAINAPGSLTLSGKESDLRVLSEQLDRTGTFNRFLAVEIAYHSAQMEPHRASIETALASISGRRPELPLVSTVTGKVIDEPSFDASYWWRNVREPVRFMDAIETLLKEGHRHFLEVGPHPVIASAIRSVAKAQNESVAVFSTLNRKEKEAERFARAIAELTCSGVSPDWAALQGRGSFTPLPLYPFQRKRFWKETKASAVARLGDGSHPLLGSPCEGPGREWSTELNESRVPWLGDHVIGSDIVFPGAGYVEVGLALRQAGSDRASVMIENLNFVSGLVLDLATPRQLRTILDTDGRRFSIYSAEAHDEEQVWTLHAQGRLCEAAPLPPDAPAFDDLRKTALATRDHAQIYAQLDSLGLNYTGAFRLISRLHEVEGGGIAELHLAPDEGEDYILHPALLDGCFQSLIGALPTDQIAQYVPSSIRQVRVYGPAPENSVCHVRLTSVTPDRLVGTLTLCDARGKVFAEARDVTCSALVRAAEKNIEDWLFTVEWQNAPSSAPVDTPEPASLRRWALCATPCPRTDMLEQVVNATPGACVQRFAPGDLTSGASLEGTDIVVFCAPEAATDPAGISASAELLLLVQSAMQVKPSPPRLVVVAAGGGGSAPEHPAHGALLGMMRVVGTEYPELKPLVLDLPASASSDDWQAAIAEVLSDNGEAEVAFADGSRTVPRYRRAQFGDQRNQATTLQRLDSAPLTLATPAGQGIEGVHWQEARLPALKPGEVRLQILAHSVNFKDILKILNLLDPAYTQDTFYGEALGMEATARVIEVGDAVQSLKVGDEIVALTKGGIHSVVTTRVDDMFYMPRLRGLDAATNATLMIAYGTAFETLTRLAHVEAGERVLIHAGAGGVGQAAIKICKMLGATVYATAGSKDKRSFLRDQGCAGVYDSRSLEFVDGVRRDTDGYGVDVVLNSISGEAATASLELLAAHGRFVEIGKRDFAQGNGMQLAPFNRALTYIAYDMDRRLNDQPVKHAAMMRDLWAVIESGALKPTVPETFQASEFASALGMLSQSNNIGKVAVNFDPDALVPVSGCGMTVRANVLADCTYLITGGLTGLGVLSAHALADLGAQHVVLVGRRGPETPGAAEVVSQLAERGVQVTVYAADMSRQGDVETLIRTIEAEHHPLKGIIHGAGILDDGMIDGQTSERLHKVMAPKAAGAWYLHQATRHLGLDHFVIYSSFSAIFGNSGQVAYAAANAMADALIAHRRSEGLAGLSINWGAVAEIGMAARNQKVLDYFEGMGLAAMAPAKVSEALKRALASDTHQYVIGDLDVPRFAKSASRRASSPFFEDLRDEVGDEDSNILSDLAGLDLEDQILALTNAVREEVASTVKLTAEDIDPHTPFANFGIDSLMTVELQMGLSARFGMEFSTMQLMQCKGAQSLALGVHKQFFAQWGQAAE